MNNDYLYEYFRNNDYKKELQDVYVVVEGDTLYNISKKLVTLIYPSLSTVSLLSSSLKL